MQKIYIIEGIFEGTLEQFEDCFPFDSDGTVEAIKDLAEEFEHEFQELTVEEYKLINPECKL